MFVSVFLCHHSYGQDNCLEKPKILPGDGGICPGTNVVYTIANSDNAGTIEWFFSNGISRVNQSSPGQIELHFDTNFEDGEITVSVKNDCGQISNTISIAKVPLPGKPELRRYSLLCPGVEEFTKTVATMEHALEYRWDLPPLTFFRPGFPEKTEILQALTESEFERGLVYVTAIGQCGPGERSDPMQISRIRKPATPESINGPLSLCMGLDSTLEYFVDPIEPENVWRYKWSIPDIFTPSGEISGLSNKVNLTLKKTGSGQIKVYAISSCGDYGDSGVFEVNADDQLPKPEIVPSICETELTVKNAKSMEWFYNGAPILKDKVTIPVLDSGEYFVKVSNFCNAEESEHLTLHPLVQGQLFLPNVITPNGDGKNEFFTLNRSLDNSSLVITNRWGIKVFSSDKYLNDWNAFDQPGGTYFFELGNVCLAKPVRGWISVLK